tara:strand:+ start:2549 stop:2965 length:417 start_codon:yes stop_codon:yes gene_type:complete
MIREDMDARDPMAVSALGEIAKVITGNAARELAANGYSWRHKSDGVDRTSSLDAHFYSTGADSRNVQERYWSSERKNWPFNQRSIPRKHRIALLEIMQSKRTRLLAGSFCLILVSISPSGTRGMPDFVDTAQTRRYDD